MYWSHNKKGVSPRRRPLCCDHGNAPDLWHDVRGHGGVDAALVKDGDAARVDLDAPPPAAAVEPKPVLFGATIRHLVKLTTV